MRVLVLTGAYPAPSEPTRAVYVENLTRALVDDGGGMQAPIEATVVAPRVARSDPLLETRRGIRVRRFPYPSGDRRLKEIARPSPFLLATYLASGLRSVLEETRSQDAEVILCHWVLPTGPVGAAASALLGVPLVVLAHGSDLLRHAASSRLRGSLARWALSRARLVLAVSDELRRIAVERLGVPPDRARVLSMGVDAELFSASATARTRDPRAARQSLGLDPESRLLLFVGDLIPEKGVLEIVAAIETLRERGVTASAAFLGEGPLRGGGPAARGNGLHFPGRVPQTDLPRWHEAADVLVLPSASEGAPVTVMEALSSGLPVVASRVGGIPDLIEDGVTGWLVPPRDAPALSALLEGLLRNGEALHAARRRLADSPPDHSVRRRALELREALASVLAEGTHGDG